MNPLANPYRQRPAQASFLVDSHCHLHDREFFSAPQAEEMLARARENNVRQIICIGTDVKDSFVAQKFAESHDDVFWTFGIHPEESKIDLSGCGEVRRFAEGAELRRALARDPRDGGRARRASAKDDRPQATGRSALVAIGEVGLDYHRPGYDRAGQIALLEQMLALATELSLPCSFHVRDAFDDFFAVVKNFPRLRPSVLHSFTDSKSTLETALSQGFYIGINGIATFANLECYRDIGTEILSRILLETDAPFLTPEPKRGRINEPGYVKHIAEFLATKFRVPLEEIAEKTTQNVQQVFNLPNPSPFRRDCSEG